MKSIVLVVGLACVSTFAVGSDTSVRGHVRSDGTYVAPYHRTTPDSSRTNNYGSQGNYNPYTGQSGTVDPYRPQPSPYPSTIRPIEPIRPFGSPRRGNANDDND